MLLWLGWLGCGYGCGGFTSAFVWFAVIVLVVACGWCLVVVSSVLVVCCDFDSVWVGVGGFVVC